MKLHDHERRLFGLCYRLLGVASEAEEVVQDTFVKALERQPSRDQPLGPWLTRVAVNLCKDRLRRRRRAPYRGSWLPQPTEIAEERMSPEAHVSARESASYAWLLALEALTPQQRTVLVLRDVFAHSSAETAELLETSEGAVGATLFRARKAMSSYRGPPADADVHRATVMAFTGALAAGDHQRARALLLDDSRLLTDSDGRYTANLKGVHGPEAILAFFRWLRERSDPRDRYGLIPLNGALAVSFERHAPKGRVPPRGVLLFDVEPGGRMRQILTVVNPAKLPG